MRGAKTEGLFFCDTPIRILCRSYCTHLRCRPRARLHWRGQLGVCSSGVCQAARRWWEVCSAARLSLCCRPRSFFSKKIICQKMKSQHWGNLSRVYIFGVSRCLFWMSSHFTHLQELCLPVTHIPVLLSVFDSYHWLTFTSDSPQHCLKGYIIVNANLW